MTTITRPTIIKAADLIESVADALQFISYYHPMDYIRALGVAYEAEQGPAAKDAIAQILTNSRMCAEGHRPICQDTGIVTVFVKWGQDCRLESQRSLQEVVEPTTVGWILVIAGVLALVLGLVMNNQRSKTTHVEERRDL